jgi:hypothetical protein
MDISACQFAIMAAGGPGSVVVRDFAWRCRFRILLPLNGAWRDLRPATGGSAE